MNNKKFEQLFALFLILVGMSLRLLPHPANFTPVEALALFAGTVLSGGVALTVPLLIMMASDLVIGPHPLFWLVWGCFFLTVLLGTLVKRNPKTSSIVFGTLGGSVLFFALTNLGVFLFQNMYTKNLSGLLECYTMALPFFRNSLAGDVFYTFVFFGIFYAAKNYSSKFFSQKA